MHLGRCNGRALAGLGLQRYDALHPGLQCLHIVEAHRQRHHQQHRHRDREVEQQRQRAEGDEAPVAAIGKGGEDLADAYRLAALGAVEDAVDPRSQRGHHQ